MSKRKGGKKTVTTTPNLPVEQTKKIMVAEQTSIESLHVGPLPPPDVFAGYDRTCPGAAERILNMAERQASHRQELEKMALKSQSRNSLFGLISGTFIGLAGIGASTYIAVMGHSLEGMGTMIASLAALVGVYVYGKHSNREEMIEKQKLMNSVDSEQES